MTLFSKGLRHEIMEVVDLQPYNSILELVQLATKVELTSNAVVKLLLRVLRSSRLNGTARSRGLKMKIREIKGLFKDKFDGLKEFKQEDKSMPKNVTTKTKDLTCFKCHRNGHYTNNCPNARIVVGVSLPYTLSL